MEIPVMGTPLSSVCPLIFTPFPGWINFIDSVVCIANICNSCSPLFFDCQTIVIHYLTDISTCITHRHLKPNMPRIELSIFLLTSDWPEILILLTGITIIPFVQARKLWATLGFFFCLPRKYPKPWPSIFILVLNNISISSIFFISTATTLVQETMISHPDL